MSALPLLELAATGEAIATIVSVRPPKKALTNYSIACRISSFQGSAIYIVNAGRYCRVPIDPPRTRRGMGNRGIVAKVICEAGRDEPARWNFNVRGDAGFLTPVAPQSERKGK